MRMYTAAPIEAKLCLYVTLREILDIGYRQKNSNRRSTFWGIKQGLKAHLHSCRISPNHDEAKERKKSRKGLVIAQMPLTTHLADSISLPKESMLR